MHFCIVLLFFIGIFVFEAFFKTHSLMTFVKKQIWTLKYDNCKIKIIKKMHLLNKHLLMTLF